LIGGRGNEYVREASPLSDSLLLPVILKKGEGILQEASSLSHLSLPREYPVLRVFKRGVSPSSINKSPSP